MADHTNFFDYYLFSSLVLFYREGTESTKGKLEIVEFVERSRSDAPEFLKKIGDEMVFRGMAARFTALVTGIPEPEYEWVFNGRPLFPTDRYLLEFTQFCSNLLKFNFLKDPHDPRTIWSYKAKHGLC